MSMTVSVSNGRVAVLHDVRLEISRNVDEGLIPLNDVANARMEVIEALYALSDVIDDREMEMVEKGDAEGVYESLKKKMTRQYDSRPYLLKKAMEKYQQAKNSPHSLEDVQREIERKMNQKPAKRKKGFSR